MSKDQLANQKLESALEHNHFVIPADVMIPQISPRRVQEKVWSKVRWLTGVFESHNPAKVQAQYLTILKALGGVSIRDMKRILESQEFFDSITGIFHSFRLPEESLNPFIRGIVLRAVENYFSDHPVPENRSLHLEFEMNNKARDTFLPFIVVKRNTDESTGGIHQPSQSIVAIRDMMEGWDDEMWLKAGVVGDTWPNYDSLLMPLNPDFDGVKYYRCISPRWQKYMVTTDGRELRPSKNQIDTIDVVSSSTVHPSENPSLFAVQRVELEKGVFKRRFVDIPKVNDNLGIPWFDETELFLGKDGEIYAVGRENHPEAGRATEIIYDPKKGILNTLAHFHI